MRSHGVKLDRSSKRIDEGGVWFEGSTKRHSHFACSNLRIMKYSGVCELHMKRRLLANNKLCAFNEYNVQNDLAIFISHTNDEKHHDKTSQTLRKLNQSFAHN